MPRLSPASATERKKVGKLLTADDIKKAPPKTPTLLSKKKVVEEVATTKKRELEPANIYSIKGLQFGKKDGKPTIHFADPGIVWSYDQSELMAIAEEALGVDVSNLIGQPREMQRKVINALRKSGVKVPSTPPEESATVEPKKKSGKSDERVMAKEATMPTTFTLDKDGLPSVSPIVGRRDKSFPVVHVDRSEWDLEGKMLKLHQIAQNFFQARLDADQWDCGAINCHDCVEHFRTNEQIVGDGNCLEFSRKKKKDFGYKETKLVKA